MSGPDDLDKLTEALHAAARAERPSDARKEEILERVIGKPPGGRNGGQRLLGPLVVLALIIGGVTVWQRRGATPPPEPPATPQVVEPPSAPTPPVAPPEPQLAPVNEPVEPPPTTTPISTPAQPAPSDPPRPRRPVDEPDLLAREVALLDEARAALSTDAKRTLAILEQHRRDFPKGALRVEAELVRIEAHLRTGDRRRAEQIGNRLIKADPTGPVAARARRLLEDQP